MTEFIIIGAATLVVFSLFLGVMALKERRAAARPPIHTCTNSAGCQCKNRSEPDSPSTGRRSCVKQD